MKRKNFLVYKDKTNISTERPKLLHKMSNGLFFAIKNRLGEDDNDDFSYGDLEDFLYDELFKEIYDIELIHRFQTSSMEQKLVEENEEYSKINLDEKGEKIIDTANESFWNFKEDQTTENSNSIDIRKIKDYRSEVTLIDITVKKAIEELREQRVQELEEERLKRERFCEVKQRRINLKNLGLQSIQMDDIFAVEENIDGEHNFEWEKINNYGMEKLELLKANLKIRGFFKKEENYRMFPMNRSEQLDFCKA